MKSSLSTTSISRYPQSARSPQMTLEEEKFMSLKDGFSSQANKSRKKKTPLNWKIHLESAATLQDMIAFRKWDKNFSRMKDANVVDNDLGRTRADEPFMHRPQTLENLKLLCCFYCIQNNLRYQQGLLELIVPFLLLKNNDFPLEKCYAYFNAFMTKFCPSMLMPKPLHSKYELPHLVSAMSFCEILLNYHNPDLLNLFKSCEIESEAIIVPWIVTFFIKDIPLELSYLILDRIINRNDKNYIFYMMIGFFLHNQNTIIANREMDDYAEMLPFIRRTLKESIQTRETLLKWLDLADQVEANTPKSFEAHLKFYGFFEKDLLSENDIKGLMSFQIGKIMAIYPFELLEFLARTKNTEMAFKSVTMEREVEEDGINFTIVDFRMEKKDLYLPFTIDIPVTAHTDNSVRESVEVRVMLLIACGEVYHGVEAVSYTHLTLPTIYSV
eukprot:TRINITY_DN3793_c0_g3_i4.p1 TRINITY_DN3793_c0_g3~~TRINITY_DN3793_c0_g3_i4.p1  ORF type:complete len:442 (+),score=79.22 TRINITY_DN3793_c0_g3_i4:167-1492(+)